MSLHSLNFAPTLRRSRAPAPPDYSRRDRAIELFDDGKPLLATHETLAHLLPSAEAHDLQQGVLEFAQGSARVQVQLSDGELRISAPLARVTPASNSVAALRYCLSRVAATGQLFQPRLRAEALSLEFSDALSRMHPQKLLEVLKRLPSEADQNDHWMIERFGLEMPDRAPLAALDANESERALELWQQHWQVAEELLSELRRKRSVRLLNAIGSYLVDSLHYALPLYGELRNRLNEYSEHFSDTDLNPSERDAELAKCIRDMRRVDATALAGSLGHAEYAIDPNPQGTASQLSRILGDSSRRQLIGEMLASGRALEAALELASDFYYLLAYFHWAPATEAALRHALDSASGRPWSELAEQLLNHAGSISHSFGSPSGGEAESDSAGEEDSHVYQD